MLTGKDLQSFIDQNQIEAEILPTEEDTPTVPDAARALGVEEEQIIKSLVFLVDGQPALVVKVHCGAFGDACQSIGSVSILFQGVVESKR